MNGKKEIIVVSPSQYWDLARMLTHKISKAPGCNGLLWKIKRFEDNECQIGGNHYVLFIGNSDENVITKDFLPVIKNVNNQAGACYGFDGTKAVAFGEGKLEQYDAFQGIVKKSLDIAEKASASSNVGADIAVAFRAMLPSPILLLFDFILRKKKDKDKRIKKEKELRKEQTEVALTLFLAEHFDNWIGLKK